MTKKIGIAMPIVVAAAVGLGLAQPDPVPANAWEMIGLLAEKDIDKVIDDFHDAASKADLERYIGCMAADGVFLGTDATERWTRGEFEAFARPHFEKGRGWTYRARDRHVTVSADGSLAWFDELLDSESYGECRGTGCVVKVGGGWKIAQYSLSIPMPNDLAKEFVGRIREFKGKK